MNPSDHETYVPHLVSRFQPEPSADMQARQAQLEACLAFGAKNTSFPLRHGRTHR